MRFAAILAASLALTTFPALAEKPDPMPVTAVSFSPDGGVAERLAAAETPQRRGLEFGQPEGSGFRGESVLRPRVTATGGLAARRQHRAFVMPWQMGVYQ